MNCQINFGRLSCSYDHEYGYSKHSEHYNGVSADKKVLDTMQGYCPFGSDIADIGAGDGRNAIPLAKLGYNLDAFELSSKGRELIKERSQGLSNIRALPDDIFETPLPKEKYSGIVLAHVTQHFNFADMTNAFSRFNEGLKKGGILLFDALEDTFQGLNDADNFDEIQGNFHFKPGFIGDLAQKIGFEVKDVSDYAEDAACRGHYYGEKWGFGKDAWLVKLKWFTLRKP